MKPVYVLFPALLISVVFLSGCPYIPTPPSDQLRVIVTSLPSWESGQSGSINLTPIGGTPPYHCYVKKGSALPAGFSLSEGCVLSGTAPVLAGGTTKRTSPTFTVVVNDSAVPLASIELEYQIKTVLEFPT